MATSFLQTKNGAARYRQPHKGLSLKRTPLLSRLSLCLLMVAGNQLPAHAAPIPIDDAGRADANSSSESSETNASLDSLNSPDSRNKPDSSTNRAAMPLSDAQLEEALVALKLKQAVEKGFIDASVLEDYKRETLGIASANPAAASATAADGDATTNATSSSSDKSPQPSEDQRSPPSDVAGLSAENPPSSNGQQSQQQPVQQPPKRSTTATQATSASTPATPTQAMPIAKSSQADTFEQAFGAAGFDTAAIIDDRVVLQTPSQIEQAIDQIEAAMSAGSAADTATNSLAVPTATLAAKTPPIGLDMAVQAALPVPNNLETLGLSEDTTQNTISATAAQDTVTHDSTYDSTYDTDKGTMKGTIASTVSSASNASNASKVPNVPNASAVMNPSPADNTVANRSTMQNSAMTENSAMTQNSSTTTDNVTTTKDNLTGEQLAQAQEEGDIGGGIDPSEYLPEYQSDTATAAAISASDNQDDRSSKHDVGFFKGIYNRLFHGGYAALPKISANIYLQDSTRRDGAGQPVLVKADNDTQPAQNIEAALEEITVEAISDFTAVLPKLREQALNAAQAVGYYDIHMRFRQEDDDSVAVVIEQLGEPVRVQNRLVDIRGEGHDLAAFALIAEKAPPLPGDVFNHGAYETIKTDIALTTEQYGFFDSRWLNNSVDIILPDNTADIDLIYDTQKRYEFGEVVYFTIDDATGQLTTDPDKLPVTPKLLHQLYHFAPGDKFYQPLLTRFTNDLSATQYFNMVNVEPIKPSSANESGNESVTGLQFEAATAATATNESSDNAIILDNIDNSRANANINASANANINANINANANTNASSTNTDTNSNNNADINADTNTATDALNADTKPIEFSVDQQTNERLQAITAKANRLSRAPADRVLDQQDVEAKNFLGKISNAISNVFAKILPDEDEDSSLAGVDLSDAVLQGRQTPQQVAATKQIPLYVFVMADKPKDVNLGIGYGTDTGVRAVARLDNNLINREGYQAGVSLGLSSINQSLSLRASRPWQHPLDDKLVANLSVERELINQGEGNLDLTSNTIKAGVGRNIRSESGWNRSYSLAYRLDELESGVEGVSRKDLPIPFNRSDAKFTQQALLLGYALDKTVSDNVLNPTRGWRQFYSLAGGANGVLTDTNMAILRAGFNGVYSFGDFNKHQLVGRVEGGYIWADDFADVPYKLRFFAGGDGSIRGYDYDSLSPLENGYLLGGQVLALGSAEYNYEFKPGFRGAVFADVGNAYDTDFNTDTKLGVGFGIRWASPVGMVRADLAAGVLEEGSIPIRLHFFIGSPLQ